MESKSYYEAKLQSQQHEIKAQIEKLKGRARDAEGSAREELNQAIESLEEQGNRAKQRLEQLQDASGNAWDDVKTGVDRAYQEIGKALSDATDRFR